MKYSFKRFLALALAFVMVAGMLPSHRASAITNGSVTIIDNREEPKKNVTISNAPETQGNGNVAKVGTTEYATIGEAIAAWTNNTTLTLLADVTLADVVTLNSTEHHILDLGTYTMTAAEGKNAFVIKACGTGSAERTAITINADATNPGGINAGNKCVIYYKYADGGISTEDRPIIKINGGVFTGSTSSFGTAGIYTIGTAARKCATLNITGGTFNCSINGSGKSKLLVYGGTFNYSVGSQGDSTALRLISGGKFKTLGFMTADSNNTKFWFGTSMANSNVGLYVDKEGYLVVGGPVITELSSKYVACASNATKWSSYLQYSSAATYGLFYEDAAMAIAKHGAANVTVYEKPAVTVPDTLTGEVVEEIKNNTALKDYAPENLPEGAELEIELVSVGETIIVYDVTPMANGTEVEPTQAITFRLPVPASVAKAYAKVYHDGTLMGIYKVEGEGNAKYVEISSADFSEFAVEPIVPYEVYTYEELLTALENNNAFVKLKADITATATQSSGYGKAGIVLDAGDVLDGNGHKLTINGANGTWDCAIAMKGGEVKNLTIAGAMRGVFMPGANGDVVIDHCVFENVIYTFNSDAGSKDYTVTIKNTALNGWTSFSAVHKSVTFEGCTFGEGSGYAFCRPYQATTFVDCDFAEGYEFDTSKAADNTLEFTDCTYNGEPLSIANKDMFYNNGDVKIDGVETTLDVVALIGSVGYATLAEAIAAVKEGETIIILAGTYSEGTIKLPATLKNVTIKGAEGAILKDMTISAADGNAYSYIGLTFDGITFDNSRLLFTGWRNGEEIIQDLTITNCVFKNLNDSTNTAPVHINKEAAEAVVNFTFTNNVIDGAIGGSKSGVYAQLTGKVVFTGNVINNVSFRPYVIQITTDDGIADEFIVTGNTFSGSKAGRAQGLGNNAAGTDTVKLVVSGNIFKGITESQQICYWNFNPEKTTADLSKNYYDIDIKANPSKIYFNSAAQNKSDLADMGIFPYYSKLNEDGTIDTDSLVGAPVFVAQIDNVKYESLEEAFKAATSGCTIEILADVTIDYYWDARFTGAKFTVPVTINGNGHTIKFTNTVYDGGNYMAAFRFEADATVKDLTIDMSEALSGFAGRFRAISAKGNLTVDNCTFIGNGSANNTRAIIFGEGAGDNVGNLVISVTDSTFTGWKRGVSDNENAQDVKTVTVTGNIFNDASVYISAAKTVTFTGNTVTGAYVDIRSYTTNNNLSVTATGNTLTENTDATYNYIMAGGTITAQSDFVLPAKGSNGPAYTGQVGGYVRLWGEGGGNAKESFVLKLYSDEILIATTKLNNIGGIIDGDVFVTWYFFYPASNDEYWTTTWEEGHPNSAAQPTHVVLYIDGEAVATTDAVMSGADDLNPVKWEELVGVKYVCTGLKGSGTEADPYLITRIEDLLWLQAKVDEQAADGSTQFAGKYFKLTANIDLAGINWNPIGSMSGDHGSFKGVFDGAGHTISNLYVEQAGNGLGLFARTAGNAVIKNLNLVNVTVKSTDNSNYVGGVVGNAYASTKIENVHVSGDVYISGQGYIGGIAGHGYVVMDNVSVKANEGGLITSTFWCAGGILGYAGEGSTNIMNAHVEGLTITSAAGGLGAIVGMAEDNNGTQPISGSNLSAKNVVIKTYVGGYGTAYADYALGYLYGGNPTSKLTGTLTVENVKVETSTGAEPTIVDAVAKVGEDVYFGLQEAINAASEGDTITLLRDVTLTSTIKVLDGQTVTLDLNGKTIDGTGNVKIAIMSYGNLTIKDSSDAHSGTVKAGIGTSGNAINICGGTFTLESGNIYSLNNAILVDERAATITIKGGKITAEPTTRNSAVLYISSPSETVVTISGGELIGYNGILLWNNTTIDITGGSIKATGSTGIQGNGSNDNTKINISGGEISGYYAAIYHPQGGELNISGGELTGWTGVVVKGGKVTISGGKISGTGEADTYRPVSSGYVDTGDGLYIEHYDKSTNSENYGTPTVIITGGTFISTHAKAVASYANTNNNVEALTGFITGGIYSDVSVALYMNASYTLYRADTVDGYTMFGVKPSEAMYEASINGKLYLTLQDAIDAIANGEASGKIDVRKDVVLNAPLTIPAGATIVLNLNGYTISQEKNCIGHYGMIENNGDLTITGNGKISFKDTGAGDPTFGWGSYTIINRGTLTVENGTIEHLGAQAFATHMICAIQQSAGSTTINGGTISTPYYRSVRVNAGKLTINGGTFDGQIWLQPNQGDVILSVTGGNFAPNGGDASAIFMTNAGENCTVTEATISGGTFNGKIGASDASKLAGCITGGIFTADAANKTSVTLLKAGYIFGQSEDGTYGLVRGLRGAGTESDPYQINDIEDLKWFRDQVNAGNNYSGKYIKLNANIDLANEEWTPIGYMGKSFVGNFDGGNFTIKNLKITKELANTSANNGIGFFGRVDSPAVIKNLVIENVDVTGSLYVGALVGYAYTGKAIENVTVKGDITIDAYWYAGVIGGNGYMNLVNNCHVIGNDGSYIKGNNGSYIGGIWGFRGEGGNKITNCTVTNIDIIGVDRVGGISGMGHYGNTISGCEVKNVTITATDPEATTIGLIVGACQGTVSEPTQFKNNTVIETVAQVANGDGSYKQVTCLFGTKIDGSDPVTNYVAKIGTEYYETLAEAIAAAQAGDTVTILSGEYTGDLNVNKDITVVGEGNVTINGKLNITANGVTVKNLTVKNATGNAGYISAKDVLIEGCTIVGNNGFRSCYTSGTVTFKDSTITGSTYGIHFDGSAGGNIVIDNCVITGWTSFAATIEKVTITDSEFLSGNYNVLRFYQDAEISNTVFPAGMRIDSGNGGAGMADIEMKFNGCSVADGSDFENVFPGGVIVASDVIVDGNMLVRVAKIGGTYYKTLAEAMEAAQSGDTVTLLADIALTEGIAVATDKKITLDLNGKTITGTDNATGSFGLFTNKGELTITGNGTITLVAKNNRGWNAYSSVISNTVGGKLIVESGTIEHLGGTDMAYAIDNLTNGKGTRAETVINGGTIKSTYRAIRQFLNGTEAQNILTINGGIIEGANKSIWMQDPSANANSGILTVGANAVLTGDVYLTVTAGSTEWPVEVSIARAALDGESKVLTSNVPADYDVQLVEGCHTVLGVVAKIGDIKYPTLAAALAAAKDGDVIELIWAEGNAPIAMNGSVFGKTVTITGTATVDWSKGFLFVGRGGEGDGTVIFDNAHLTSASDNASYGIHVSGREKNTNDKYDGTLIIRDSVIELDYLINKGTMTLENSTLTVKNGFSVGGRPASETESGADATATLNLTNGSKLIVNNHNGMGLGYEAIGVMNVDATSTFETTQSFQVTAKGTMNIAGTVKIAGTLTNKGTINLTDSKATLEATEGLTIISKVNNYMVVYDDNDDDGDGVYSLKIENVAWIMRKGTTMFFTSLEAAINAALDGETIVLMGNITVESLEISKNLTIADYKLVTLTVTDKITVSGCTLTIDRVNVEGEIVLTDANATLKAAAGLNVTTSAGCSAVVHDGETYKVVVAHTPGEAVKENGTAGSYESVVYCTKCGVELSRETIVTHTHTLTEVAAKAPTLTVAGNIAYYTCECGKYFSDAEGQNEIAEGSWILAALAAGTDAVLAIKPTSTNTPATLMLGAELKMSFNVDAKKTSAYDRVFLQITKRGVTTDVEIYSSTASNHSYRYTLAAPEMTVEMTVVVCGEKDGQIYVGDPITFTYKDIVVDKMDAFYNGTNEKNKVYGCALLANLLKYGEEAQKRFNIDTDNLATSGLSETYLAMINTATPALDTWVAPAKADYYLRSYTPMLQEQIKIAMYFTVPDATSLEGYEVRIVRGDTGELINAVLQPYSDTRIRCDFALAGAYGRDNLAITLYKDGVAVSETVNTNLSALAQGKQSDTLNPLLYAMMNYCDAAKAFFG